MNDTQIVLLVLPIVVIQLVLIVVALRDISDPSGGSAATASSCGACSIVFVGMLGPILYLTIGREEAEAAPAAVACRALTKRFDDGRGVLAVDRLDLDVPAGSVFGLLGPTAPARPRPCG